MDSWSLEDKTKLLALLREYGTGDLELIKKKLQNKTLIEIQNICSKHNKLALKKWHKKEKKDDPEIKSWIYILKRLKHVQNKPVQNIIPRVLKYIALFEKREESSSIDLSNCYQILSKISEGTPFVPGDETYDYFFNDCLGRLAIYIKTGEIRSFTTHLKSLRSLRDLNPQSKNSRITCSKVLNPLAIPDSLLKMSESEKMADEM